MRDPIYFIALFICQLQLACEQPKAGQSNFGPKLPRVVEARSRKIPIEESTPPTVIPATGVKKVKASAPEVLVIKPNVFDAKPARIVRADSPRIILPAGERFKPPQVTPALDSPYRAGPPEIILLKELFVKENNPASFSSIKATHGLNSNEISSLCVDKTGNLWIGAWWGGVTRYDGSTLANYSVAQGLSSDVVSCVLEDSKGNIWIGTTVGGVNRFDGKFITHFSVKHGLSNNIITHMLEDKAGNMWFGTRHGLNKYDGRLFTCYTTSQGLPSNDVKGLLEDSKGNLWVCADGGMTRFDGHAFQNYTHSLDVGETLFENIVEDSSGNLWFGTDNGLWRYDGKFMSHFTAESGLSSRRISRITKDNNGDLWIGTWDHGANKYDGKTFTHLGVEQGLGNDVVPAIVQDKRGNIWLATTAGVSKYDGKLFSHVVPLRQEEVECVFADSRGNIWIGTGAGNSLNKYDGKSLSRFTTAHGLVDTKINQVIEDKSGNIWFATRSGVEKYDGVYFTHYSAENGLINDIVYCLMEDRKGNFWFGTENGLSKFDGKAFVNYAIRPGAKGETIYSVLEDHAGNIWIGTNGNGLYSFDGTEFTHYDLANSLSHPMALTMMQDKNNDIWICTGMGVNKFDGKNFTWYTTEQGLSNNIAKNLLEDKDGNIWVGTINGMNLLRSGSAPDSLGNYFKRYTTSEGFLGGGTYENSITQDQAGNIWIGATDKIAQYHPQGDIPDTIPPVIQLSNIALFNEKINWLDVAERKDSMIRLNNGTQLNNLNFNSLTPWYNQPEKLQLNYNNNYLTFQFIGITTYRPKEVRYQYFLEGLEERWGSVTSETEATYNNLPHGNYVFRVRAVNSEGFWSGELNYPFAILPPWWRTWWAYFIYAASSVMLIWLFTWYRSRQLKAENIRLEEKVSKRTQELEQSLNERYELIKKVESQEALLKERLRISRELHDDIGSTLSSISIYSEVARKRTEKRESTSEILAKIGHASRELIDKMSDIVWSLNPNNESFEQLQNRMGAFAIMILSTRNVLYHFNAGEELRRVQFTGEQRKNIFLIFKEALHNIVKYANCTTVNVSFSVIDNKLMMEIMDDGKGFDSSLVPRNGKYVPGKSLGGNGINNMQARADDLNATLCIQSKSGEGTTIQLVMVL